MNAHLDDLALLKRIPLQTVAAALGLAEEGTSGSGGRYRTFRGRVGKIVANCEKGLWNANGGGSGSTIDLVMVERQISFTAARQWLRALVANDDGASFSTASFCSSAPESVPELITTFPGGRVARQYLLSRGLDAVIIDSAIDAGAVVETIQRGRRAVAFPHLLSGEVVGAEVRNPNYKSFVGQKSGLWQYGGHGGIDLLVVVESAIDGLAYSQLHSTAAMLIVSTGGNPARRQLDAIRQLLDMHTAADLIAGNDADSAGEAQAAAVQAVAAAAGRVYARHRPNGGKDWAEQLNGGGVPLRTMMVCRS